METSSFSSRAGHEQEILHGKLFSPELMVGSDLTVENIRTLFKKFKLSYEKNWIDVVYNDNMVLDAIRPKLVKDEL